MIPGKRAQIHYWSRHTGFLKRLAFGIVAGSFVASLILIAVTPSKKSSFSMDPVVESLRQEWQELQRGEESQPHELARWLYMTTEDVYTLCDALDIKTTTWADYQKDGRLGNFEARTYLQKSSPDAATLELWEIYIHASLSHAPKALQRVHDLAMQERPPITANQLLAYQSRDTDPPAALRAMMREATLFPETQFIREQALGLAVQLKDQPVIRQILAQPEWWSAMPVMLRHSAAAELGDLWLQFTTILEFRSLLDAPPSTLIVALVAAAIWYAIFVLHGVRGTARWLWPLLPLLAGIFSVWPVLVLGAWQEVAMGMSENAPFPQNLWFWIGGVGMREEVCKLFFAALFMPWLLYKRPAGGALLVGAFVGLGFALEENIGYYLRNSGGVAISRLFTANFFHAALTGIATHSFYQLLRSRLGTAERFLITFVGVVLAHGLYDYLIDSKLVEGTSIFSLTILALTAWQFLDLIEQECPPARQWISPAAVFILGTAVLIAVVFISVAILTPERQILASTAASCISVLPVGFIYWRRLGG